MNSARQQAAAGFSLLELLISVTLLALTLGAVVLVGNANDRAYQTGITAAHLDAQLGIATERIVSELRTAERGSMQLPVPGLVGPPEVGYVQVLDFVAGVLVTTPDRRLAFEYEFGELDDGLDNNSNGLVDEGRVVLTENLGTPEERRLVLSRWVPELLEGGLPNGLDDNGNGLIDEPGFWVGPTAEADGTMVVMLALQRRDATGRLMMRTSQSSIRIRN
jgi:hypothetical protein